MTRPHREFNLEVFPLGYLITFRAYGTWLHGDSRGSVDRFHNQFGSALIPPNSRWRRYNERTLKRPPVSLRRKRRADIQASALIRWNNCCSYGQFVTQGVGLGVANAALVSSSQVRAHFSRRGSVSSLSTTRLTARSIMRKTSCWLVPLPHI